MLRKLIRLPIAPAGLVAVMAALLLGYPAQAATYNIANGDIAAFKTAINTANSSQGPDTIVLAPNGLYSLTTSELGNTGVPGITSQITIIGNNSRIERNAAPGTPAFRIFAVSAVGDLTLRNVTVSNGFSTPNEGFVGGNNGGAIFNRGTLRLIDSTLTGNTAQFGAGVMNLGGNLLIRNSTISYNTTVGVNGNGGGGGAAVASYAAYGTYPTINIVASTLFENRAGTGNSGDALLITGGALTLRNTILASPTRGTSADCQISYAAFTSNSNNIAGDGSCGLNGPGDMQGTDPKLGALAAYGGTSVLTNPPQIGSPAINSVPLTACVDETGAVLGSDQRGVGRPIGAACDAGAHESPRGHGIQQSRTIGPAEEVLGGFGSVLEAHMEPLSGTHDERLSGGHDQRLSELHDRRTSEAHDRRVSDSHDVRFSPVHDVKRSMSHDERRSVAHDLRRSVTHDTRLSEGHDRRFSPFHDRRRSEGHDERLSGTHDQRLSGGHDPRISAAHDPRRSEAHDTRASEGHDLRLSAAHDARASASHDRRVSEAHDQKVSGAHDPRRSEAHDARRSEAHDRRLSPSHDVQRSAAGIAAQ